MHDAVSSLRMQKSASLKKAFKIKHLAVRMKDEKDEISSLASSLGFPFKINDLHKDEGCKALIEILRAASSFQPPP